MRYFILIFAYFFLATCGQKGPLYLPEESEPGLTKMETDMSQVDKDGVQHGREK